MYIQKCYGCIFAYSFIKKNTIEDITYRISSDLCAGCPVECRLPVTLLNARDINTCYLFACFYL